LGYLTGLIHVHVYIVTRYQLVKYNNMYDCGKFFLMEDIDGVHDITWRTPLNSHK
jgi:hypothetical protein